MFVSSTEMDHLLKNAIQKGRREPDLSRAELWGLALSRKEIHDELIWIVNEFLNYRLANCYLIRHLGWAVCLYKASLPWVVGSIGGSLETSPSCPDVELK